MQSDLQSAVSLEPFEPELEPPALEFPPVVLEPLSPTHLHPEIVEQRLLDRPEHELTTAGVQALDDSSWVHKQTLVLLRQLDSVVLFEQGGAWHAPSVQ